MDLRNLSRRTSFLTQIQQWVDRNGREFLMKNFTRIEKQLILVHKKYTKVWR